MDLFFDILVKFGLPVAAASVMGMFIYIILKYILGGVVGSVTNPALPPPLAQPTIAKTTMPIKIKSTNFFDMLTITSECKTWTSASHFFCI